MLRRSSQQALKALRNPLHNLPTNILRGPLQARHLHNAPPLYHALPFQGPPSYATIARRWSSMSPSPMSFLVKKKAEEAKKRGEFVDVHDIGGVDPESFDVLITDIDKGTLHSDISELVGLPYLKEATEEEANEVVTIAPGFVYGKLVRNILPCVVSIKGKARWVFFLVDPGSPLTYISAEAAQSFGLKDGEDPWLAKIAGYEHRIFMSPDHSHFASINLLGNDFYWERQVHPWYGNGHRSVTYYIGDEWNPPTRRNQPSKL